MGKQDSLVFPMFEVAIRSHWNIFIMANNQALKCLESLLSSLPSTISYFEFLVIARELRLRFDCSDDLVQLKRIFEEEQVTKERIRDLLIFKHKQIFNNNKIQIVGLNMSTKKRREQEERLCYVDEVLKKLGFLRAHLTEVHGSDRKKWFKAFDLSDKGLVRMYELRWMMGSRMNGLFTEAEIKLIHDSLSTGDGITREEFVRMFDGEYMGARIRQSIKHPLRKRISSGVLLKEYPFQMISGKGEKNLQPQKTKTNPNLRYFRKRDAMYRNRRKTQDTIKVKNGSYVFSLINEKMNERKKSVATIREESIFVNEFLRAKHKMGTVKTEASESLTADIRLKPEKGFALFNMTASTLKASRARQRPVSSSLKGR